MMSEVAEQEQAMDAFKGMTSEGPPSTDGVVNNNMRPFVTVPRREPKEWFDAVKAQAGTRPATLTELSK